LFVSTSKTVPPLFSHVVTQSTEEINDQMELKQL
jgi:hypothetical protein